MVLYAPFKERNPSRYGMVVVLGHGVLKRYGIVEEKKHMPLHAKLGRSRRAFGAFLGITLCTAAMLASAENFPFFDSGWPVPDTCTAVTGAEVTVVSIGVRTPMASAGCSLNTHIPAFAIIFR